ncbi:hypothetical protein HGA34_02620 [Candidatus Falkowbacteria bacterium]|nr:hypothetical protein [Candidatus Falkowbacteria bacterium]
MSQAIKKQLKRSYPVVAGFLILNIAISAVFFNMRFNLLEISWLNGAQAQDSATSSVTVKNAPPAFTVNAAENPTSSSTSPVNVGANISFTGTADDPENNSYYLIVCDSTATATPGAGGAAPTCSVGNTINCVSGLTGDTAQASCTYGNVADPGAETKNWAAFVCDNHATQAQCTTVGNSGSGDSGSPYYVNHAPTFTAVATTDDNKDPGGIFTIQGNVGDTDAQGGVDTLTMSVCSSNSWSTTTGCAATTFCTGTTTGATVSCTYTSPVPMAHGTSSYYAFVKDWHQLASAANSRTSVITTNNVAPSVSNIVLNGGSLITLLNKGAGPKTVTASSSSVTDNNGCADLVDATSTIYYSAVAGGADCTADDNNCYKSAAAACNVSDCSGGVDTVATVVCSAGLEYHAIPTDISTGNPYTSNGWIASIFPYDETLSASLATSSPVDVFTNMALDVSEATIPYGILQAGQNTAGYNATTTVINFGNCPLASDIDGTWMSNGGNHIGENNQKFDLSTAVYGSLTYNLSSTTPQTLNLSARPTSAANVTRPVYWGINIPALLPSGDYYGTNTFTAGLYSGGVW